MRRARSKVRTCSLNGGRNIGKKRQKTGRVRNRQGMKRERRNGFPDLFLRGIGCGNGQFRLGWFWMGDKDLVQYMYCNIRMCMSGARQVPCR